MDVAQIPDRIVQGIPPEFERARDDTETLRDETEGLLEQTRSEHSQARTDIAEAILRMQSLLAETEAARDAALGWVGEGSGINIGPEQVAHPRAGHVWVKTRGKARTPLYPRNGLYPDAGLYPERSGQMDDGRVITSFQSWDAASERWVPYLVGREALAPEAIAS